MKLTKNEARKIAKSSSSIEGYKGSSSKIKKEAELLFKKAYRD
ncbi:MAG: hypothetical protein PHV30_07985 [Candidatus Margulisbacteria bacterium]|nr:hypothetical protein [Candidatus Margulisiibacteriota bacterium]